MWFIQNTDCGYAGAAVWWRKGGDGYTVELTEAEVFADPEEVRRIMLEVPGKYVAWPVPAVLRASQLVIAISIEKLDSNKAVRKPEELLCQKR